VSFHDLPYFTLMEIIKIAIIFKIRIGISWWLSLLQTVCPKGGISKFYFLIFHRILCIRFMPSHINLSCNKICQKK
jgi:hypothetical protein